MRIPLNSWTVIPLSLGHSFRKLVDSHSVNSWTPILKSLGSRLYSQTNPLYFSPLGRLGYSKRQVWEALLSHAVALREKGVHIIAQWRLPVVKIKEILGLHHPDSLSGRVITRSLDISPTTITNVLSRAKTFRFGVAVAKRSRGRRFRLGVVLVPCIC